jgi:hypothetical protein
VWDDFDAGCLAESIHTVAEGGQLARQLTSAGLRRYQERFRSYVVSAHLESVLGHVSRDEVLR